MIGISVFHAITLTHDHLLHVAQQDTCAKVQ
jgi:hypothetical protein